MSSDKTPLESAVDQALDAFVYAPIGLLFDGPALFPKLVKQGKNQVQVARMMGQMTVQMGQTELTKRAEATEGPVRDVLVGLGIAGPAEPATPATQDSPAPIVEAEPVTQATAAKAKVSPGRSKPKSAAAKKTAAKVSAKKASPARNAASAAAGVLGIADYDSLSASQVVSRLRGLVPEELDAVKSYESANRARKTVLNKIVQLQKG